MKCSHCQEKSEQIETYVNFNLEQISVSLCPECVQHYPMYYHYDTWIQTLASGVLKEVNNG